MLLFLNDIAASEVMVIFLFILLFFGSKSIPGIARTMGKTIRQIKDASDEVKAEIQKSGADMKKDLNLKSIIRETEEDLKRPLDQMAADMDEAMNTRTYNGRTRPGAKIVPETSEENKPEEGKEQVASKNSDLEVERKVEQKDKFLKDSKSASSKNAKQ